MHAFGDRVVSDDEAAEKGNVVDEAPGLGGGCDPPQPRDYLSFADHPPRDSLALIACKAKAAGRSA